MNEVKVITLRIPRERVGARGTKAIVDGLRRGRGR